MMGDGVKNVLTKPLQLADQVTKWADDAQNFKQECQELKSKTEKLSALLRQAARADLYERPTRRIMDDTEQVLDKALALVSKCRRATGLVKRLFIINPAAAFKKMSTHLDNSLGDVSWLIRVSAGGDDGDGDVHLGLPPIAQNEPILCLIWEQIATLHTGNPESRADAAASLVSLARDNGRYGKLIIEEDGVGPLLRLVKDGQVEAQENAARAIGLLGRDPESVEQMVLCGVCSVFAKVLKEGPMKVQAVAAWAVSELAANHPKCQDAFAQNNLIRLLISHLAFETVQEHSKYTIIPSKATSIHSLVMANNTAPAAASAAPLASAAAAADATEQVLVKHPLGDQANKNKMRNVVQSTMAAESSSKLPPLLDNTSSSSNNVGSKQQSSHLHHHHHLSSAGIKGRESEDPATKTYMKAMAAKALWHLAKGNAGVCKHITEFKALLCFAILLEKGTDEVQYNSAMALMEIARVAEKETELRRSVFKPNSPAVKAVVDQLLRIVEKADYDEVLLVPCIVALGCLSRTFRATETRIIGPLVRLLDEREPAVSKEAAIALTKFACDENYLRVDHCKSIINYGGVKHLVQLVFFGEPVVQIAALVLLCYIAYHAPESEPLSDSEVGNVLEWASKQGYMVQDPLLDTLLPEAKGRVELYKSTMGYP